MSQPIDLKQILNRWRVTHGKEKRTSSGSIIPQIHYQQRYEKLKILVEEIKALGKPKYYFTDTIRNLIIQEIIPRENRFVTAAKVKGFRAASEKDLDLVIEKVYLEKSEEVPAEQPIQEIEELDLSTIPDDEPAVSDTVDPEMEELLGFK